MAASIDGKISTASRESFLLGSKHDWRRMDELRAQADAILNGAGTIRSDNPPVRVRDEGLRSQRKERGKPATPWNILASNSAAIDFDARIFKEPDSHVVMLSPEQARRQFDGRPLPTNFEVSYHGAKELDLTAALHWLKTQHVELLLVEGGGTLNGELLRLGAVDEVFLTIAPSLIGGKTAPTPFDGPGLGLETLQQMELVSCEMRDNEVFLRYLRDSTLEP
jgi:riboflavin-specific deaminase-like protein